MEFNGPVYIIYHHQGCIAFIDKPVIRDDLSETGIFLFTVNYRFNTISANDRNDPFCPQVEQVIDKIYSGHKVWGCIREFFR